MNTFSKYLPAATSTLLGGMLVVFGLNGFLNFIPMAAPEGEAGAFMGVWLPPVTSFHCLS
jgi:hypothetical protein